MKAAVKERIRFEVIEVTDTLPGLVKSSTCEGFSVCGETINCCCNNPPFVCEDTEGNPKWLDGSGNCDVYGTGDYPSVCSKFPAKPSQIPSACSIALHCINCDENITTDLTECPNCSQALGPYE
jgi:hypothetical protein